MDEIVVTEPVRATVEILDAGEILVTASDVRETVTIIETALVAVVESGPAEIIAIEDPSPVDVELAAGPASSVAFQDGPIAVVEVFEATFGLRGPKGDAGTDAAAMQPTYRLRPAGGWNEAVDTYEDLLPSEPLDPTEVVLVHAGNGPLFHVDPPDADPDPDGGEFQLSGPRNRTVRFGLRPREGEQVHVEPYLRAS